MIPLTNLTPKDIITLFDQWGEGPNRARRLNRYLFRQGVRSWDEMPEMRRDLLSRLSLDYFLPTLRLVKRDNSADGTEKFLFALPDGKRIESVTIPDVGTKPGTRALCISTQVGCALSCTFCYTGLQGLTRNLETWEIIEQVYEVSRHLDRPISHLVYMGMGEPLHNFAHVMRSIRTLTAHQGLSHAERKITVSTAGLLPQMQELGRASNVQIALSLHAPTDDLRDRIMPINRKYRIQELIDWLHSFPRGEQSRFMVEYILLDEVNNRPEHALKLAEILRGIRCKLNLIPFNAVPGLPYTRPSDERNLQFQALLAKAGLESSIRRSRGRDILGACGQLSGIL